MESQEGPVRRPLKDKFREHWETRNEIFAPKPERANTMGMLFSWIFSITLTIALSFVIIPELETGFLHQIVTWLVLLYYIQNWRLCRYIARATTDNIPQPSQRVGQLVLEPGWKDCAICQLVIPPRAHHCKVCGYCVLKRDHHCFFTGTCIDFKNQRRFIVFLAYSIIGSLHGIFLIITFLNSWDRRASWTSHWYNFLPGISFLGWLIGSIPFGHLFLLTLLHTACVTLIATTAFYFIEICMVFRGQTCYEAAHDLSQYRCSPLEGFRSTFGKFGLIHFILPISLPQEGDGVHWPVWKNYKRH